MKALLLILLLVLAVFPQVRRQGGVRVQGGASSTVSAGGGAFCSGSEVLCDDFNDNSLDAKWSSGIPMSVFGAGAGDWSPAEQNQQLEYTPTATSFALDGIQSTNTFNMTDKRCMAKLVDPLGPTTESRDLFEIGQDSNDDFYALFINSTDTVSWDFRSETAGNEGPLTFSWNPATDPWISFVHSSGSNTLKLETAPDSGGSPGSWTTQVTVTSVSTKWSFISTMKLVLGGGNNDAQAGSGTGAWDNLKCN
jgi:hypothetical protein